MTWNEFTVFAIVSAAFWIAGAVIAFRRESYSRLAAGLTGVGLCFYTVFIIALWITLQRPPLKTMGETRLWYSFFIIFSGLLTYRRWHYRWLMLFSTVISLVFVITNILKPEIHDRSLMPALQSFWFVPHVTVYIFFLFRTRLCIHFGFGRLVSTYRSLLPDDRPPRVHRHGIPDARYDERGFVGESGVGKLLELGPERDVGGCYVVYLFALHTPETLRERRPGRA